MPHMSFTATFSLCIFCSLSTGIMDKWRRSVVKYGSRGQSGQAIKLFSDYTLRQWFPNIQHSRFLTACRRLEKLVLPSIFDTSLSSLMMWNVHSYPTTAVNERSGIFGVKTYSDPFYKFSGAKTPSPLGSTPPVMDCKLQFCAWCFDGPRWKYSRRRLKLSVHWFLSKSDFERKLSSVYGVLRKVSRFRKRLSHNKTRSVLRKSLLRARNFRQL